MVLYVCVVNAVRRANDKYGFNPLMATLKPQSNGPLYGNTVIDTLAVGEWAVTFGTVQSCLGGLAAAPPSPLSAIPNVTAHPSTVSVPTSYCSLWHYNYLRKALYSNTVIGTLAVDVTFGTARRCLGGLRPRLVCSSLYQI